jgi:HAD superfamily hydrolase (TIGR01509 family)
VTLTKIIVFDLDGVLIDSAEANYQAFAQGLSQWGLPRPDRQEVLSLVGLKATEMLIQLGCPSHQAPTVFQEVVRPFYLEHLPSLAAPMPGAKAVLEELQRRQYCLLACTSGDRRTQTAALESVGLGQFFKGLQAADDSIYGKPDPRYLQELLTPYSYSSLFQVEDAEVGLRMGQSCGATTIFAEYGFGSLAADFPVDHRISQLEDLLAIAL